MLGGAAVLECVAIEGVRRASCAPPRLLLLGDSHQHLQGEVGGAVAVAVAVVVVAVVVVVWLCGCVVVWWSGGVVEWLCGGRG